MKKVRKAWKSEEVWLSQEEETDKNWTNADGESAVSATTIMYSIALTTLHHIQCIVL